MSRRGCLLIVPPAVAGLFGAGFLWPEADRRAQRFWQLWTDETGPVIQLSAPAGRVKGEIVVTVAVSDPSSWEISSIDLDGDPLPPQAGDIRIDTSRLTDGQHVITVRAIDRARLLNRSSAHVGFESRNSGPLLALAPGSNRVGQGQTLVVRVDADGPATIEGTLDTMPLAFVNDGASAWALAGIDNMARTGARRLNVSAIDELGNRTSTTFPIQVDPVAYPNEYIWLPPSTSGLIGSDLNAREIARLDDVFAKVSQARRWNGPFAVPVKSGIASDFATGRSYNGGPITSRHWGTDFDCQNGTPVTAPAPGQVVLVDRLAVRGTAVVLDHGLGVFSCYYHLSRADVRVGQSVETGQPLALSGETGAVTGPHLHWEMRVRGLAVDPMIWTRQAVP